MSIASTSPASRIPLTPAGQPRSAGSTSGQAAEAYIDAHRAGGKNNALADQWAQSLRDYGRSESLPIAQVDTPLVMACLKPIWSTKTETATRVRGRIKRVLDWAKVHGLREGDNPARWRGHPEPLLPKPSKVKPKRHHATMPFADVPAFMARQSAGPGRARGGSSGKRWPRSNHAP